MRFSVQVQGPDQIIVGYGGRLFDRPELGSGKWLARHGADTFGEPAETPEMAILSLFPETRMIKMDIMTE